MVASKEVVFESEEASGEVEAAPEATPSEEASKGRGAPRKTGLRKRQVEILAILSDGVTRSRAELDAHFQNGNTSDYLGRDNPERRARDDMNFPSLVTLGHVKAEQHDVEGKDVMLFSITASGRKALAGAAK